MKELFINSVRLMNMCTGHEKAAACIMYSTAFIMMMRSGTLYRKEYGKDGFARYVINVEGTEYRLQESIIKYLAGDLELYPYDDQTLPYMDICVPSSNIVSTKQAPATKEPINIVDLSKIKQTVEDTSAAIGEAISAGTDEIKEAVTEPLPEPEITLTENEQAQYVLEETEYYKVGAALNLIASLACIVVAIVITVFG